MKNTIEKTMNELRTDHRNMAMLLDALDAESARLQGNDEPDYELIGEIIAYMSEYPDAVHHPKEDLIYRHIHSQHTEIDTSLEHIESDHRALGVATVEIQKCLADVDTDGLPDRKALTTALQKYSRDLREHMYWEEKDLFEIADSMQDDAAWAELLKRHNVSRDPLFGNSVERRYRKLFNHIQRRIVWDKQQFFV